MPDPTEASPETLAPYDPTVRRLPRHCATFAAACLLVGCGCQPITLSARSPSWAVGEIHAQPCLTVQGYLDADGSFWEESVGGRLGPATLADCNRVGGILYDKGSVYWYAGDAAPILARRTLLIAVDARGAPLNIPRESARPDRYGPNHPGGFYPVECGDTVPGVVRIGALYFSPSSSAGFPQGYAPDCHKYATISKLAPGQLVVTSPSGSLVTLRRYREHLLEGCA